MAAFVRKKGCIFCAICDEKSPAKILYKDQKSIVFEDIKPATKNHFLVVPLDHINNITHLKDLVENPVQTVEELVRIGKQVLQERNGDLEDCLMGFHWPPFHSISHLHLHVMSPASQMNFVSRLIYRPGSFYFATPEVTIDWIKKNVIPSSNEL